MKNMEVGRRRRRESKMSWGERLRRASSIFRMPFRVEGEGEEWARRAA